MRLITRSDFDGLACAVLLKDKAIVDEFLFAHPKDLQDGKIEVTENDVLANVPYVEGCGLWFDHHLSEDLRLPIDRAFEGESRAAPSAAQVIWDYYGGDEGHDARLRPLLEAVNKSDSGDVTREEILDPQGWLLLSFVMDPRTGLGRFSDYRVGNYQLMEELIDYCCAHPVEEILAIPDVKERVDRYEEHQEPFRAMLLEHAEMHGNVLVTDLRPCETIFCGNRFIVYALFPDQNVELRIMWGKQKQNVVFTCGHSVLNRTCKSNVATLMLKYGGGGHEKAGTCQVAETDAARVRDELVEALRAKG